VASWRVRLNSEQGVALVVALFATMLMTALATGLTLSALTETMIAANFRAIRETQSAAEGVLNLAIAELEMVGNWSGVLGGQTQSNFTDSPSPGLRQLPGVTVNLSEVEAFANCAKPAGCTEGEMTEVTPDRPWGPNNPRWRLFLHAPIGTLAAGTEACCYVVALVADDTYENDANPEVDGSDASNPGWGVILVRGEAFGLYGSHAVSVATVSRRSGGLRILTWGADVP
jgi:Tfp pilus assembly protein PilX